MGKQNKKRLDAYHLEATRRQHRKPVMIFYWESLQNPSSLDTVVHKQRPYVSTICSESMLMENGLKMTNCCVVWLTQTWMDSTSAPKRRKHPICYKRWKKSLHLWWYEAALVSEKAASTLKGSFRFQSISFHRFSQPRIDFSKTSQTAFVITVCIQQQDSEQPRSLRFRSADPRTAEQLKSQRQESLPKVLQCFLLQDVRMCGYGNGMLQQWT